MSKGDSSPDEHSETKNYLWCDVREYYTETLKLLRLSGSLVEYKPSIYKEMMTQFRLCREIQHDGSVKQSEQHHISTGISLTKLDFKLIRNEDDCSVFYAFPTGLPKLHALYY